MGFPQGGLLINHHADQSLNSFCQWQSALIGKNGKRHDHAILLTGFDICSWKNEPCDTLGMVWADTLHTLLSWKHSMASIGWAALMITNKETWYLNCGISSLDPLVNVVLFNWTQHGVSVCIFLYQLYWCSLRHGVSSLTGQAVVYSISITTAALGSWSGFDWSPWYLTVFLGSSVSFRKLLDLWRTQVSCICTRHWVSTKSFTSVVYFLMYSTACSRNSTSILMNGG